MKTVRPLGLYIHIPFCKAKCVYCDFYSLPHSEDRMDAYTDALCAHLTEAAPLAASHTVDTVYFGGGTPEAVKSAALDESKDQLVVATNAAFEPFEYMKGDDYYGIDMEIAACVAKKLGKELVIQNMDFDAVCLSVGQHKCDIAMAGLTISEDRKEYVNFSDAYYEASQRLIVKGTDTTFDACKSADDVKAILDSLTEDKKIGCQQGTTGNSFIEGSEDLGFPGLKAKAVAYKSGSLAVQDLINGGVDYVIIDSAPAASIAKAINDVA